MPRNTFKPGNKAAAGHGRPKLAEEFKTRCRRIVDEKVVQRWEDEVDQLGEHWVKCSELLAAYGMGKPVQALEVTGALQAMNTEQLMAALPEALAVLGGKT